MEFSDFVNETILLVLLVVVVVMVCMERHFNYKQFFRMAQGIDRGNRVIMEMLDNQQLIPVMIQQVVQGELEKCQRNQGRYHKGNIFKP